MREYLSDKHRFIAVLKINIIVFIAELAIGYYSGSLSMISDGFHVSLHVVVSLVALISEFQFFGLSADKIKRYSAGINIALFFPLAIFIGYEANTRLTNPPVVSITSAFFLVAVLGLVANIYTVRILHEGKGKCNSKNQNRFLLYSHMIVDTISSLIVLIGAGEIYRSGNYILDPKLSFVLACLILLGAIKMSWDFFHGHSHDH